MTSDDDANDGDEEPIVEEPITIDMGEVDEEEDAADEEEGNATAPTTVNTGSLTCASA